jgi:hypothetical protein
MQRLIYGMGGRGSLLGRDGVFFRMFAKEYITNVPAYFTIPVRRHAVTAERILTKCGIRKSYYNVVSVFIFV